MDELRARLEGEPRAHELTPLVADDAEHHLRAVAECVERIAAGELFQANVCLRLNGRFEGSAADAFIAAAEQLRPTRGAFLDLGESQVLSFSPELFLRREHDLVTTSPIKGTATDRHTLERSTKDAAEHVMIVDLSRNDLGRVARYGTVSPGTSRVERHPGLYHLVTDVTARTDATDAEIVKAAFPPGSVTGAPKIQALKAIASLEPTQREVYTGAIGFASPHAGLHLNVAIRTLEIKGHEAWMGCGGGIVADSDPHAELEEALTKARPIARALGSHVIRAWPRRPDPQQGLLETIAVRDGALVDAQAHLDRLAASARALYDLDGAVLETATANVWILQGDTLVTPPADGRLLPGVTRARLLTLPNTREARLTLDDLEHAEAVLLSSSIRLVTPAGLAQPTQRSLQLAEELRRHPAISRKTGSYIR